MKLVNLCKLGGEWEGEAHNSGIILSHIRHREN